MTIGVAIAFVMMLTAVAPAMRRGGGITLDARFADDQAFCRRRFGGGEGGGQSGEGAAQQAKRLTPGG
jgi:hypothetical protein